MSAIPCLAYRRRKEAVEKQIKEHQHSKMQSSKEGGKSGEAKPTCPFAPKQNNQTNEEPNKAHTGNEEKKTAFEMPSLKSNQKVVVSIQTTEEKAKENMIRNLYFITLKPNNFS